MSLLCFLFLRYRYLLAHGLMQRGQDLALQEKLVGEYIITSSQISNSLQHLFQPELLDRLSQGSALKKALWFHKVDVIYATNAILNQNGSLFLEILANRKTLNRRNSYRVYECVIKNQNLVTQVLDNLKGVDKNNRVIAHLDAALIANS